MKVAIVAKSPSSRYSAPYDDPSWQIWTVGALQTAEDNYTDLPRIDRWYELHAMDWVGPTAPGFIPWLEKQAAAGEFEVWVREEWPDDLPSAKLYPVREITERFGHYITNSVTWMILHALHEGATEIGLWGTDMAHGSEYWQQRPSCEWALGLAQAMLGKENVHVPETCDLLKAARLYAVEDDGAIEKKIVARQKELADRISQTTLQRDQQYQIEVALNAQAQFADHILAELNGELAPEGRATIERYRDEATAQYQEAAAIKNQADATVKMLMGAKEDCQYWQSWFYESGDLGGAHG